MLRGLKQNQAHWAVTICIQNEKKEYVPIHLLKTLLIRVFLGHKSLVASFGPFTTPVSN